MRISDWSSDVCSSDLVLLGVNIDRLGWERQTCACIGQPSLPLQRMISWYHDKQQADHPVPSRVILRRRFALSLHEEVRQFGVPQGSLVERTGVRSEERGVGKECVRKCGYRGAP